MNMTNATKHIDRVKRVGVSSRRPNRRHARARKRRQSVWRVVLLVGAVGLGILLLTMLDVLWNYYPVLDEPKDFDRSGAPE